MDRAANLCTDQPNLTSKWLWRTCSFYAVEVEKLEDVLVLRSKKFFPGSPCLAKAYSKNTLKALPATAGESFP